eukprot:tig00000826_g4565.t1
MEFGARQTVNVSVPQASLLRAYVERNAVDIDLALVNRGRPEDDPSRSIASSASFDDEEAIVYPLEPRVLYTLEVTFYRWGPSPAAQDACPRFVLHLAVAPAVPPPEATCAQGGLEILPPQVPPSIRLGIDDYEYESEGAGGGLRLQQRRGEARRFDIPLEIAAPARLYAEVGSDFLTADLNLRLFALGGDPGLLDRGDRGDDPLPGEDLGAGYERDGRSLLAFDSLDPGRYVLRVYEPAANGDGPRCAPFAFRLRVAPAGAAGARYPSPAGLLQLPPSLDSVAFLGVAPAPGKARALPALAVHAAGLLAIPGGRRRVARSNFTIEAASVLRLHAAPHRIGPPARPPPFLPVFALLTVRLRGDEDHRRGLRGKKEKEGGRRSTWSLVAASDGAYGAEAILAALQPGTYLVQVEFYPSASGYYPGPRDREAVPFELALEPAAVFAARLPAPGCQDAPLPAPAPDGAGYYRRDDPSLALSWATVAAAGAGGLLRTAQFTPGAPSLLYVAVGYDFAAGGAALSLNRSDDGGATWREAAAAARGAGWAELRAPLSPRSSYRLLLRQDAAPLGAYPHCTLYSALVEARDASAPRPARPGGGGGGSGGSGGGGSSGGGTSPPAPCDGWGVPLPTELAEADPTAPLGAGLDSRGALSLAGSRFLLPAPGAAAGFAVPLRGGGQHLLRTFARWPASAPGVEVSVRPYGAGDPGAYSDNDSEDEDDDQEDEEEEERRRALRGWVAGAGGGGAPNGSEALGAPVAASYGPAWRSELRLVPASASPLLLEVRRGTGASPACAAFALGVGADGRLEAYAAGAVPLESVLGAAAPGAPPLKIALRLGRDSALDAALAFDHAGAFFSLEVLRGPRGGRQVSVAKSEGTPHASAAPISFTQELHGTLPAGDYVLSFRADLIALRALARAAGFGPPSAGPALCLPFVWSLRVAPVPPAGSSAPPAAIRAVTPPGALQLNAARPLRLRVTFTSAPWNATGPYPAGPAAEPQRGRALSLVGSGQPPVYPSRAAAWSSDPLTWVLDFPPASLAPGVAYSLAADPDLLRAADGSAIIPPKAEYRVLDGSCGGPARGKYNDREGYCSCSEGHAGPDCGACDVGYGPGPDPRGPCARLGPARPTPLPAPARPARRFCTRDSCSGHGRCDDSSGAPKCDCFAAFTGPRCDRCAEGFLRYPACEKARTPFPPGAGPILSSFLRAGRAAQWSPAQAAACPGPCEHGRCDAATGRCVCEVNWAATGANAAPTASRGPPAPLPARGPPARPGPGAGPGPGPARAPPGPAAARGRLAITLGVGGALLAAGGAVAFVLRRRAAAVAGPPGRRGRAGSRRRAGTGTRRCGRPTGRGRRWRVRGRRWGRRRGAAAVGGSGGAPRGGAGPSSSLLEDEDEERPLRAPPAPSDSPTRPRGRPRPRRPGPGPGPPLPPPRPRPAGRPAGRRGRPSLDFFPSWRPSAPRPARPLRRRRAPPALAAAPGGPLGRLPPPPGLDQQRPLP